jgi:hypothetical protein
MNAQSPKRCGFMISILAMGGEGATPSVVVKSTGKMDGTPPAANPKIGIL